MRYTALAMRMRALKARRLADRTYKAAGQEVLDELEFDGFVKRLARMTHQRKRLMPANDGNVVAFVNEAPVFLYERLEKFRIARMTGDPFVSFASRCLGNFYVDVARGRVKVGEGALTREDGEMLSAVERATRDVRRDYLAAPEKVELEVDDYDAHGDVRPVDSVMLFFLTGRWPQVPKQTWGKWLKGSHLPASFPTPAQDSAGEDERREVLAAALGRKRSAIDKRFSRLYRDWMGEGRRKPPPDEETDDNPPHRGRVSSSMGTTIIPVESNAETTSEGENPPGDSHADRAGLPRVDHDRRRPAQGDGAGSQRVRAGERLRQRQPVRDLHHPRRAGQRRDRRQRRGRPADRCGAPGHHHVVGAGDTRGSRAAHLAHDHGDAGEQAQRGVRAEERGVTTLAAPAA